MIKLMIDGTAVEADENTTILEAARKTGIYIPTLCHLPHLCSDGLCRICVVEAQGSSRLVPACSTLVSEGMVISTDSEKVQSSRKRTLDYICQNHRMDCEYCSRYTDCELHGLVAKLGLDDRLYLNVWHEKEIDSSSPCFVKDYSKCTACRRCEAMCRKQGMDIIGALHRASETRIGTAMPFGESGCACCGMCVSVCPTGALSVKDDTQKVWNALRTSHRKVIAVLSPEMAEMVGTYLHCSSEAGGRLAAVLRKMGFAKVYMLAGAFPYARNGRLAISARCPAAVKYISGRHPQYSANISYDSDPVSRYAKACKAENENAIVVFASACAARKAVDSDGIDIAVTARELVKMINRACVSKFTMLSVWKRLVPEAFDVIHPPAEETEHGNRAGYVKRVEGLAQLKELLDSMPSGEQYDVIEAFACPGGCRACGGLPFQQ